MGAQGWAHIAATAAVFELPTLIMGVASIYPPLRSNMAFTSTFFATRVFLHLALLICSVSEHGRNAPGINGSWGPAISLVATYPMHLWWGYKCICSVRRRMHKRKLEAAQVAKEKSSLASAAGQLFNGMPAPDISSAVNTPATTPVLAQRMLPPTLVLQVRCTQLSLELLLWPDLLSTS